MDEFVAYFLKPFIQDFGAATSVLFEVRKLAIKVLIVVVAKHEKCYRLKQAGHKLCDELTGE